MRKILILILGVIAFLNISAQQPQPLPMDAEVRYGQLDNGLTYYIRHNEHPKQRCEFHIAQAVGAILEEDDQNGLAHFLEHMAFNGTQHFPGKGIINYFESIGVNFGGNINAYTSIDKTVYRLSNVPTIREGIIDSALLVMHDWACGLLLLPEEIDAERGVIREEWRTRNDANFRMNNKLNSLIYPDSRYGIRNIIGDTAVINNFSYDALRAYYKKWYGPDNQAIIVVGDIDVDAIEAKIRSLWADVPERVNRGERPLYSVNDNEEPLVAIVTDPEAQNTRITVQYKHDPLPTQYLLTDQCYVQDVIHDLIFRMMNERLGEQLMDPNCTFMGSYAYYHEIAKLKDAFELIYIPKKGAEITALNEALLFAEKMRRYGFTQAELERAKTQLFSDIEMDFNGRSTRDNISHAQECIVHFTEKMPMPGIEWEFNTLKELLPVLPLEAVNSVAKGYVHNNPTIAITGPQKEGVDIPTEEFVLTALSAVKTAEIDAPKEEVADYRLIKQLPKAGKIKKTTTDEVFGTTTFTLSNGARVIIKPTTFKQDEVQMHAFAKGGQSLVSTEDLPSANLMGTAMQYMGLGDFDRNALGKVLTGKNVSVSSDMDDFARIDGLSTVKDFETLLQLTYLNFTALRRDDQAFHSLISLLSSSVANKASNPNAVFRDSMTVMQGNHNERIYLLNKENIEKANLDAVVRVHEEIFANPANFTFMFVGNIDPNDPVIRQHLCQYIGSLKGKGPKADFKDDGIRRPQGLHKNYFTLPMKTRKASNFIEYFSYDIPYSLENEANMRMLGRILSTRYLESIREREGGSYGVGVAGRLTTRPVDCAFLMMQFDTDPEKQEALMAIIHEEVQKIAAEGPLLNDLNKEKASMLKDYEENIGHNSWWMEAMLWKDVYDVNLVTDFVPTVEKLTVESVQAIANQLLRSGNRFELVMTPANESKTSNNQSK